MLDTTKARDQVAELARTEPAEAFRIARTIADPWFAAQAFAWIVRFAPPELAAKALQEAREAARAGRDAYQRSAVLAWAISAALEAGLSATAAEMIAEATAMLPKVGPVASRAECAGLLLEAAFPGGPDLWRPLLAAIEKHAPPGNDWRAGRVYRALALILAPVDPDAAQRLAAALPAGKTRDRTAKELADGIKAAPRQFFA